MSCSPPTSTARPRTGSSRSPGTPHRHEIEDLNVTSQLRGDFVAAHTEGDNAHVVATDTQKNTIFAFARDGVGSPGGIPAPARRPLHRRVRLGDRRPLGRRAVRAGARINDHDHSFYEAGPETRTAVLVRDGDTDTMITGFYGLTVLKSTGSGFVGYPKDKYTTLAETTTGSWPPTSQRAGATTPPISTSTRSTTTSGRSFSRPSQRNTPRHCSRPSTKWARP